MDDNPSDELMTRVNVLRVVGYNGDGPSPVGLYVVDCDVDAYEGMGQATLTEHIEKAQNFPTPAAAMVYWRRRSNVRPDRFDGSPNRPLTAYTVEVHARDLP